ncbi:MAG: hypothetical protein S0880_36915 [Actinomycetota bacterium]|nr:hypothetical protein [Actinomycetota bacterium]
MLELRGGRPDVDVIETFRSADDDELVVSTYRRSRSPSADQFAGAGLTLDAQHGTAGLVAEPAHLSGACESFETGHLLTLTGSIDGAAISLDGYLRSRSRGWILDGI